ncbi:low molecular weight protein-tyrosine-phosphatase [Georgenia halophila]|uniref:protein-tyrosine-phosphatase n=1 Tax=Georgenia halophila TaxID=620889 RepID=A0ABP8LGK2_9MICO
MTGTTDTAAGRSAHRPFRVLVVCTGNICRSPMGAVVLRERLREAGLAEAVEVESAGISDDEHGNPIDPRARTVLAEHDYPVPEHSAHQVAPHELADFDLALAMTGQHERVLRRRAERDGDERTAEIRLWREFDASAPERGTVRDYDLDVPDPWYGTQDGFYGTLDAVERGAEGLVSYIKEQLGAGDVPGSSATGR